MKMVDVSSLKEYQPKQVLNMFQSLTSFVIFDKDLVDVQDQLRRDSKRSQSGIPLMYVLLFGLMGLILGYIMKST